MQQAITHIPFGRGASAHYFHEEIVALELAKAPSVDGARQKPAVHLLKIPGSDVPAAVRESLLCGSMNAVP